MFDKFKRASEEPADLNIIPVMNLFMVLIPFLLLGAAFVHIGVIPTSTPTEQETSEKKEEEEDEEPKSVMANLVLAPDEMRLSFSGSNISEEKLDELGRRWELEGEGFPLEEMQRALRTAKEEYPESNTVTVLPHEKFRYEELVQILDHTRERQVGEKSDGSPKFEPLFPVTVFSKFIPPEEGGEAKGGGGGG